MFSKLGHLVDHICSDTIKLFDHRLGKNFGFCTYFDCGDTSKTHDIGAHRRRVNPWNSRTEKPVASPMLLTDCLVSAINYAQIIVHIVT